MAVAERMTAAAHMTVAARTTAVARTVAVVHMAAAERAPTALARCHTKPLAARRSNSAGFAQRRRHRSGYPQVRARAAHAAKRRDRAAEILAIDRSQMWLLTWVWVADATPSHKVRSRELRSFFILEMLRKIPPLEGIPRCTASARRLRRA